MRLGIRAKLVGTLLLAGLLPLALALTVILVGVVELRIQSRGRMYRALAQQQAHHLSTILASQVETAHLINGLPGTVPFLQRHNARPASSPAEIAGIEAAWPAMKPDDPAGLLHDCLDNEIARRWQSVRRTQSRFAEVMVTDATGRLVAATNKTSDYYQADEKWWQDCYDNGRGRTLISDVLFDESAVSPQNVTGTLVADLCLPIYDNPADPANRKVVGVAKISLDAGWMLQQLDLGTPLDELPRATWLVRADGKAVEGGATPAPVKELPAKVAAHVTRETSGYLRADLHGHELMGFAAVEQSRIIENVAQRWHVVVTTPMAEVLTSIYRLAWLILGMGVVVIAGCFIGGLVIARREVIRPLTTLENAVNQLKSGNRDFRLPEQRGGKGATFRDDEIGRLAHDFNTMADQLKSNLERIEHADAVKREFIDLASHELRTPVTYILGAAQLAQRHGNGDPAAAASPILAKISAKAQRLNRIVENMFKLMASDRFDKTLRTTDVDVAALLQAVVQELDPFVRERGQRWDVRVDQHLPTIRADAEKLRDIFTNLVSNAVRFSPDGGAILVRATPSADGDGVEVTVGDTGPGIPGADLPRLFEPFFTGGTVDRHTSGDYQHMSRGMGLGLSVVKRFVDLHGGTVKVETSPNGTQLKVSLPRTPRQA